jgi:hypothetical protein
MKPALVLIIAAVCCRGAYLNETLIPSYVGSAVQIAPVDHTPLCNAPYAEDRIPCAAEVRPDGREK